MTQQIIKDVKKLILTYFIYELENTDRKKLRQCAVDFTKYIRIQRGKAKKEFIDDIIKEADAYSIERNGQKMVKLEDLIYLLQNLQKNTFYFKGESKRGVQ